MKSSEVPKDNVVRLRPASAAVSRRTQLEFLPAALEITETPASPISRLLALTIILLLVLAIGWSIVGQVDIVASASGKIVPTGRTKLVQPVDPGQITAILVQDGDKVTAGQVVIRLDQTVAVAERNHIGHDLTGARLDAARLSALKAAIDRGGEPVLLPPEGASPVQIARARSAMVAQAAAQQNKVASIDQQIAQKSAESASIAANIAKLETSLPMISEQADIRKRAMAIEFGNRIAHLDAQIKLADQSNELVVQKQRAVEITAAREGLERQREQAVAEYAHKVLSDLSESEQKAAALSEDFAKAVQKVDQAVLRAPVDGTVQQLAVHSIGGVVTPAQVLMVVVPADSRLEAEVMISNRDIGFVRMGQEAEVKIDTFNFTRYGLLHGKVANLSQDAIVRDKPQDKSSSTKLPGTFADSSEPQGQELLYAARITLDSTQLEVEGRMVDVSPGMAISTEIKTGSRRLIEFLLSPLLRYKRESMRER